MTSKLKGCRRIQKNSFRRRNKLIAERRNSVSTKRTQIHYCRDSIKISHKINKFKYSNQTVLVESS